MINVSSLLMRHGFMSLTQASKWHAENEPKRKIRKLNKKKQDFADSFHR